MQDLTSSSSQTILIPEVLYQSLKAENLTSRGDLVFCLRETWINSKMKRLLKFREEGKTVEEIAMRMEKIEGAIKQNLDVLSKK